MADGEELRPTDARRARLDRMEELERLLGQTPATEARSTVLLQEYVDLVYLDARERFGPETADSEEGHGLITTYVEDTLAEATSLVTAARRAPGPGH